MGILPADKVFCSLLLLCAAAWVMQPVIAENGAITIAYRGSGGGYIGDNVVFDGRNTYGNTILIRITGPGLPAEGVSPTNLNGGAGTATPVSVDQYGTWKFVWYASAVPGINRLQTARYTFTATDSLDPGKSATTPYMLKKRDYSIKASPDPVTVGGYVSLIGYTEEEITSVAIAITDSGGNTRYSGSSPVSSSGYFGYSFHADLPPGSTRATVRNPAMKVPFGTVFSVVSGEGTIPAAAVTTPASAITPEVPAGSANAPVPSPTRSPVTPVTILAALFACTGMSSLVRRL